jgi:uncharacterized protein
MIIGSARLHVGPGVHAAERTTKLSEFQVLRKRATGNEHLRPAKQLPAGLSILPLPVRLCRLKAPPGPAGASLNRFGSFFMNATIPMITALYAAMLGLLGAALTINVIVNRVRSRVDAGDGGVAGLAQAIRAQANFVEQAPLALIVIALAETAGARPLVVQILGIVLLATRLASAYALNRSLGQSPLRQFGGGMGVLVLAAASVVLLLAINELR